jgi:hypothetical protein
MRYVAGPYTALELEELEILVENPNFEYYLVYTDEGLAKNLLYIMPDLLHEWILELNEPFFLIEKNEMDKLVWQLYKIKEEQENIEE